MQQGTKIMKNIKFCDLMKSPETTIEEKICFIEDVERKSIIPFSKFKAAE